MSADHGWDRASPERNRSLYGYMAVVIAPLFFPSGDPTVSLLAALAVFGTAYFVRPLGGIVFGHIGDKYGRKTALLGTLICMGSIELEFRLFASCHSRTPAGSVSRMSARQGLRLLAASCPVGAQGPYCVHNGGYARTRGSRIPNAALY